MTAPAKSPSASTTRWARGQIAAAVMVVLACGAALWNPYFATPSNLENLARNTGFLAIFAIAQMFPIMVRGLDLSQGGLVALTSVAAALLAPEVGTPAAFALCVAMALGVGVGQGVLIGTFGLSAFVVTLGGGSMLTGAALLLSRGQTIYNVPADFRMLGWTSIVGIPLVAVVAGGVAVMAWVVLSRLAIGRMVYATGSNPEAAWAIGIPTRTVVLGCHVASAVLTSIGALFLSSRITSGSPIVGGDTALQAIAATVVGGVSLFGGRGRPGGVVLGALGLAALANLLNLYNISSYWQSLLSGVLIILAVVFDRVRRTR